MRLSQKIDSGLILSMVLNMWLRFDEKLLSRAKRPEAGKPLDVDSNSLVSSETEDSKDMQTDFVLEEDEEAKEDTDAENLTEESEAEAIKRKDGRRVRKVYECSKQYIFFAVTLPVNGKKTAGVMKWMFPEADWVSGNYLHCHNPRLEQRWVEVTVDTQVDALIDAMNQRCNSKELNSDSGLTRTMMFANTVEAVEAVAKILLGAGIECIRCHSDTSLEEWTRNLVDFQQIGGVFVCTDAAARGFDIPNVSHVIQAEFATSAVDFWHRVG